MNGEGPGDFTDRARVEYLSARQEQDRFAETAAAWFAAHPRGWTFSDGRIDGQLLALRWGSHNRAVLVCRVDDGFQPVIYADLVPEREEPQIAARPPQEEGNRVGYSGSDADRDAMHAAITTWVADRSTANWWAMVAHIEAWRQWLLRDRDEAADAAS